MKSTLYNTYLTSIHSSEQIIVKLQYVNNLMQILNDILSVHKFKLLFDIFRGRRIAFCVGHAQQEKGKFSLDN